MKKKAPLQYKIIRAFRRAVEMELTGERAVNPAKYASILHDCAYWLGLQPNEVVALNLEGEKPPEWVASEPELRFYWDRASAAYRELRDLALRRTG